MHDTTQTVSQTSDLREHPGQSEPLDISSAETQRQELPVSLCSPKSPPKEANPCSPARPLSETSDSLRDQRPRIFLDVCSGFARPLSTEIINLGGDTLSVDILIHNSMDLLNDRFFLRLLKLCASGLISYGAFAPSCCEYSRLKLRPGGPRPLRSPTQLEGLDNLTADETRRLQESQVILARCCACLEAIHSSGGHGHLEQPPTAMSWEEPCTQQWIRSGQCKCVHIAACKVGKDWHKAWLFATSFSDLTDLASTCDHDWGSHINIAGRRDDSGQFISRHTARYPQQLAQAFAQIVIKIITTERRDLSFEEASALIPLKGYQDFPKASQDGGGFSSTPDWSDSLTKQKFPDTLGPLRKFWMAHIMEHRWDKRLLAHIAAQSNDPLFTDSEIQDFRGHIDNLLKQYSYTPDWSIPDDQPLCLHILQKISAILQDPDDQLFHHLIHGVPTGFHKDIPLSNCFTQVEDDEFDAPPLSIHLDSWKSAHEDPDITSKLVQEELDNGWVEKFEGDVAKAQEHFPLGISVGKLGVAYSESRPPRLVVDLSVGGLNQKCFIPEKSSLPSAKDIVRSYPLRSSRNDQLGLSIDVKSAHKRVAIRKPERGLVGFSWQNHIYFYKVCPFGATFSAHWWSRLGGFLLRLCHRLVYLSHIGLLYVDDFIFSQSDKVLPISACLILLLFQSICLPISWRKCELSHSVVWIGWKFNFLAGLVSIPKDKQQKLLVLIDQLKNHQRVPLKSLQKFLGLAMWVTQLFGTMRIWLHYLYMDLSSVPATQFSVDPGFWHELVECLSDDLKFQKKPPYTAIPAGSQLVEVRHKKVSNLADVRSALLTERRVWLRVRDPSSSRRVLSKSSTRILCLFQSWLEHLPPSKSMWPKPTWTGHAAADACAHDSQARIGGFIHLPSDRWLWFSEQFHPDDFKAYDIIMNEQAQRDIVCYETLAQIAIVVLLSKCFPSCRYPLKIRSLSDNTGAESGSNSLFSTKLPMGYFLERLSLLSTTTSIDLDVSHISGPQNELADAVSRWDETSLPPCDFELKDRVRLTLQDLWHVSSNISIHPWNAYIPWRLPS